MPIRLFASDLDGTLLSFSGDTAASQRFSAAWQAVPVGERPLLCYNSGRLANDLREAAHKGGLPPSDYLFGGVGTTLVDRNGRIVREYQEQFRPGWDRSLVVEVLSSIKGAKRQPERFQSPFKSSWFLLNASAELLAEIRERLRTVELDVTVVYSSARDLDIVPAAADKGNAIRWLCDHLGYSLNEVVVAGDTGNDSSMFRLPNINGIAVGNAREELIEATAGCRVLHTAAPEADGVIEGLTHYGVFAKA
ncbi:MAG: HAD-IIB family hydrolase [Planctomycetota bacterium]|jgi:sucrose-6F-phosphate phosphohydrolase|nr:HAD-IIB family hydrolase [Planctomycetota bacterium]